MTTKHISQETYDQVICENMEDLGMTLNEAIEDAVQQFSSQGVDLNNIIVNVEVYDNKVKHRVVEILKHLSENDSSGNDLDNSLTVLVEECKKDLAHRCLAEKHGAYSILQKLCDRNLENLNGFNHVLLAMTTLTDGQPDIIKKSDIDFFINLYNKYQDCPEVLHLVLLFIRNVCTKHENNRQDFVSAGLVPLLLKNLQSSQLSEKLIQSVCGVLRVIVLDDDIRVPFGKGHEHVKIIVSENNGLNILFERLKEFKHNLEIVSEILATLSKLVVRNEYCKQIIDLGGLKLILQLLMDNMNIKSLVLQIFGALRSLAISDEVKIEIVKADGVPLLIRSAMRHQKQAQVCENVLATLAILALRNPDHCKIIVENDGPQAIVDCMKLHPHNASIQKQACLCIRNIVARTREYISSFLDLGAEELIRKAWVLHEDCSDQIKAALRDLNCTVELREQWRGERGELQQ